MINSWADIFKIVNTAYFKAQELAKQNQETQENINSSENPDNSNK